MLLLLFFDLLFDNRQRQCDTVRHRIGCWLIHDVLLLWHSRHGLPVVHIANDLSAISTRLCCSFAPGAVSFLSFFYVAVSIDLYIY